MEFPWHLLHLNRLSSVFSDVARCWEVLNRKGARLDPVAAFNALDLSQSAPQQVVLIPLLEQD